MRELHEVEPSPKTAEEILWHGIWELATFAAGGHADPTNPCYGEKRRIKAYANRILEAARAASPDEAERDD